MKIQCVSYLFKYANLPTINYYVFKHISEQSAQLIAGKIIIM